MTTDCGWQFCSVLLAHAGESAYALLEEAYLLTMVGLFVPLVLGLYSTPRNGWAANVSMLVGTGIWGLHFAFGWDVFFPSLSIFQRLQLPLSLSATACAALAYLCLLTVERNGSSNVELLEETT